MTWLGLAILVAADLALGLTEYLRRRRERRSRDTLLAGVIRRAR